MFFMNTLIYFSFINRIVILHDLAESLFAGGLLFLGITETFLVKNPLLESRCSSGTFYFQKAAGTFHIDQQEQKEKVVSPMKMDDHVHSKKQISVDKPRPVKLKQEELTIDCLEVAAILVRDEGLSNAKKTLESLDSGKDGSQTSLSGAELTASVLYFLDTQDFNSADQVLSHLEKFNTSALTRFLRGEYHFLRGSVKDAERHFEAAAGKDRAFWPAFYRIATLAAEGNSVRYEHKIKRACESLELGMDLRYECFMGGFSPDYFHRILTRRTPQNSTEPQTKLVK
jgi:chemotaxis protein methyltransferase CheR